MSNSNSRWFDPAQVFAQFTTGDGTGESRANAPKEQHSTNTVTGRADGSNREIQITETGEVSLAPEKARVSIVCSIVKDTVDEVKTSVNRRVDYILQTLRAHHMKESSYKIHRTLSRTEKGQFKLDVEVVVEFTDFTRCEQVCNIVVEKLDETVKVSSPEFFVTPGKLESLRCQACVCAVRNARNKAMEVVQLFNQTVGLPLVIRELHHEEYCGLPCQTSSVEQCNDQLTFQQRISAASVTVSVKIFVVFEIREKVRSKKKK